MLALLSVPPKISMEKMLMVATVKELMDQPVDLDPVLPVFVSLPVQPPQQLLQQKTSVATVLSTQSATPNSVITMCAQVLVRKNSQLEDTPMDAIAMLPQLTCAHRPSVLLMFAPPLITIWELTAQLMLIVLQNTARQMFVPLIALQWTPTERVLMAVTVQAQMVLLVVLDLVWPVSVLPHALLLQL